MRIRQGTGTDLNDVVDLWAACNLVPSYVGFRNELQRKVLHDPDLFLVADDGGTIIGAVSGGFDGRFPWVSRLGVHPQRRREGVAEQLVKELWRRFTDLGAPPDRLLVLDDLEEGRRFWVGLGYEAGQPVPTYRPPRA